MMFFEWDLGQVDDPRGKTGVASLCGDLMDEATKSKAKASFAAAQDDHAVKVWVRPGIETTNLGVRTLREADLIACEDTRTSGVLLSHYDIDAQTTSYHEHNEREKTPKLISRMNAGYTIALISDAGTPGISDPGFYLARECHRNNIPVQALPGPTALIPALVASGLPSERFVFEGFLPKKKGRSTRLEELSAEVRTMVFYESKYRVVRTLEDFIDTFGGDRPAAVARELTKKYEEIQRGTLSEVHTYFADQSKLRGEFVIIVGGAPDS